MSSNFPVSLDNFTNPSPTSNLNDVGVEHSAQHANANDAIEALQEKVGIDGSTNPDSLDKTSVLKTRFEGWNDLVQQVIVRPGAANAPGITPIIGGIYGYQFDDGADSEVFVSFHLGHDYVPGSMVYPHVHWVTTDNINSGNVRWCIDYTWARRGDSQGKITFDTPKTITIDVPVTPADLLVHKVSESIEGAGIPGETMETDSLIMCKVYRNGSHPSDTYVGSVHLLCVDIHYQSLTKATPSRFPPFY